jgi:1,3-beta-glucan synthase component
MCWWPFTSPYYLLGASLSLQTGSPEAQRRIKFFVNTLLMERPKPQKAISQPSWSTLTPYYEEDVILPLTQLKKSTEVCLYYYSFSYCCT